MTINEAIKRLKTTDACDSELCEALEMAIKALEQEPCEDVCEWFVQTVDIATDIVEFRFSDGTVKRAKRGLYMHDIEKSLRKMLIDQMANEKKQEPCEDCISRQAAIVALDDRMSSLENVDMQIAMGFAKGIINDLPPVTPQPKMGRWFIDERSECNREVVCSNCEQPVFKYHKLDFDYRPKYCPNCGAKMQEVEE